MSTASTADRRLRSSKGIRAGRWKGGCSTAMATVIALVSIAATGFSGTAAAQSGEPLRITRITPAGQNVPAPRQIVIEFDRPIVPLGRMDRRADEVPVEIEPALACAWRWLDQSTLACELGERERAKLATRYRITVSPGLAALDGARLGAPVEHTFSTERPKIEFAWFATWRGPGTPVMRVVFSQPVTEPSVREHLYVSAPSAGLARVPVDVEPDPEFRESPVIVPLPGEPGVAVIVDDSPQPPDDRRTEVDGVEARRVWLVSPREPLPEDTPARLVVEPGLVPAEGTLTGNESRTAVEFHTFPAFRFVGIECLTLAGEQLIVPAGGSRVASAAACNPMSGVGLAFSTPVLGSEIARHVAIEPDLAGGRDDFDPWANRRDFSLLGQPHRRGAHYTVWLPALLAANATYRVGVADPEQGPRDEFGRTLAEGFELEFRTDHRPPDYALPYDTAVLESGIDSDVPLYVTNLDRVELEYRTLGANGLRTGLVREVPLSGVEDVQYGVPLGIREMLGGASGALYGRLSTTPTLARSQWMSGLFAQVTPYQVHVKFGHFNTLVWVTSLATGEPVRGADVSIYIDRISSLTGGEVLARARTDALGIAHLPGGDTLDPDVALLYGCRVDADACPRLFVRVDGRDGFALLPLDYRFDVSVYRASNFTVFPDRRPRYGHLHAWGVTAQGVYRAGDTIEYKLYVRNQSNDAYVPPPRGPYTLEIIDPTGQTVHVLRNVELSEFGTYAGSYKTATNAAVGWYQFQLTYEREAGAPIPDTEAPEYLGNIVLQPLRVLVSDFTPAAFGVTTTLAGDRFESGDDVTAELRAALFSGGPYGDADARITLTLNPRPFVSPHPVSAAFTFGGPVPPQPITVARAEARVGADGTLRRVLTLPPDLGARAVFGRLTAEGAVRDDRGRYIASSASAEFVAVDRLVGLKARRWLFTANEEAEIDYVVVDPSGAPAAGTDVAIAIERLETRAARVRGAGNAYITRFVEEWVPAGECAGVSGSTPSVCRFVPDAPGRYRATASIDDTEGRRHETVLDLWVAGAGHVVWHSANDDVLEIVPETTELSVGDTARYLIKNPYPGAYALITIERYGVLEQRVERLEGSTPTIEIDIEPKHLPGFYLSVLVISPRVEAPPPEPGEVDLGKPSFKIGYVSVPIEDPAKRIDVAVRAERETYKPRETVRVEIEAAPRIRDRREPIEVAVAVLDEAVLDLVPGGAGAFDPYRGFFGLDGLDVLNYSLLTRLVGRQSIEKKGANPGGDGGAALSMRSSFEFVSYWNPSLVLDRRGRGSFELELPDNLTGWRVLVLAATPSDRFGLGETRFNVNQPTEIRPAMPNHVTEGDRFDAAFTVMNRTDTEREIRVRIVAEEGAVARSGGAGDASRAEAPVGTDEVAIEHVVRLGPYARTTVALPVEAARLPFDRDRPIGTMRFAVTAGDEVDRDGLLHELVVTKRERLETAAVYGTLDAGRADVAISIPTAIRRDAGEIGAVLSPTVIGNLDGAFRYLRDYPYDAWEQLLTKAVLAAHFVELAGYLDPGLEWPEAETLPARTLDDAASFQAPNGGMAYFVARDEYVSPYLSAYTALAFAWLSDAGVPVPEAVETRLHEYLETFLRTDTAPDFYTRGMASTVRAVALAALAKRGRLALADLERYRPHVERMSLLGRAHYLQAARSVEGGASIAAEVEALLLNGANRTAGRVQFDEVLDDGYSRISVTPLIGQCAILSALSDGGPSTIDDDVPFGLVRTIVAARGRRDHWENTQENAFCTRALLDYAARFEAAAPNVTATVSLDGEPLGAASFTSARDEAVVLPHPIEADDLGTERRLEIGHEGSGRLYYTARITYAREGDTDAAINAGIDVRREYSVQRGGEWVLLGSPAELRRGELVRVDLFVSVPSARHFVVVDDPVPGGLEPLNPELANVSQVDAAYGDYQAAGGSWWFELSDWRGYGVSRWSFYHQEIRHDAVRFYSEYLPPGNYHLSYTAQAIADGSFAVQPAAAAEMYDPDVYGMTQAFTLEIRPPAAGAPTQEAAPGR